jgi:hypothetical protein
VASATGLARLIGAVRAGVGVAMLARPDIARVTDPTGTLLVRTIGIRDLALGLGTLLAPASSRDGWVRAGLASDLGDLALGLRSARGLGPGGAIAVLAPMPVIAAGLAQRRAASRRRSGAGL